MGYKVGDKDPYKDYSRVDMSDYSILIRVREVLWHMVQYLDGLDRTSPSVSLKVVASDWYRNIPKDRALELLNGKTDERERAK